MQRSAWSAGASQRRGHSAACGFTARATFSSPASTVPIAAGFAPMQQQLQQHGCTGFYGVSGVAPGAMRNDDGDYFCNRFKLWKAVGWCHGIAIPQVLSSPNEWVDDVKTANVVCIALMWCTRLVALDARC